jgi:hypothetical protein
MKGFLKGTLDIVVALTCIFVGALLVPVSGMGLMWDGSLVFAISFPLYMVYVLWPVRRNVVASIKHDLRQLREIYRRKNEEFLAGKSEEGGDPQNHVE